MNGSRKAKSGNFVGGVALAIAAALLLAAGPAQAVTGQGGAATAQAPAPGAKAEVGSGKVDVNSAGAAELASLPGIGESKAAAIIAEREKKPFESVDDLERVRGIGARTLEDLRDKVTVGAR